jgi:hypothetical protein
MSKDCWSRLIFTLGERIVPVLTAPTLVSAMLMVVA